MNSPSSNTRADDPLPTNRPAPQAAETPGFALLHDRQFYPRDLPYLRTELAWFERMAIRSLPEYRGWCEGEARDLRETIETLEGLQ